MISDEDQLPRKLAAILYADVAGYSRLTGEDEDGTHRVLRSYLNFISSAVQSHNGRVVHYAGDAVLADFGTVVEALTCAAAVQRVLEERNEPLADDRKVQFRVGVNLGDVIVDQEEIYGDGVNVAARLEALAEPGGICISESVYTAVGKKLPLEYEDIGEQNLKNIEMPVRAYHARLKPGVELPLSVGQPKSAELSKVARWRWRPIAALLVLALVAVAAVLTWLQPWEQRLEPMSAERTALPLPDKPSIAVLPFDNMSNDPMQEYFSDGISENIITRLARIPHMFVIARNSSFIYKGKAVKVQQIGKDLGAHYVLEGSVQKASDRVRITVQLIDSSTGKHLWAERYDRTLDDFFDLQDEITLQVVLEVLKGIEVKLTQQDISNIKYNTTENVEAWSYYAKGLENYRKTNAFNNAEARKYFGRALQLDSGFDAAKLGIGWTYFAQARWHWATGKYPYDKRDEFLDESAEIAQVVMTRNDVLAEPLALLGQVSMVRRNFDKAVSYGKQAVARNPNNAEFHLNLSDILSFAGKPREALVEWELATHLNPFPSDDFLLVYGRILYQLKRFEEAIPVLEGIVERNPDVFGGRDRLRVISLMLLIASHSSLGNPTARKLALKHPHSYETILNKFIFFKNSSDSRRILDDLTKVGLNY